MSALTAIGLLIEPSAALVALAEQHNARMLRSIPVPPGFRLDARHPPHIPLLQRYVHTDDLADACATVEDMIGSLDLSGLRFSTRPLERFPFAEDVHLAAIRVVPSPAVLAFQADLIASLAPFTAARGNADAFARTALEPVITTDTITRVERYVPDHTGDAYIPYVAVGLVRPGDEMSTDTVPSAALTFSTAAVSIHQLGNNGAAVLLLDTFSEESADEAAPPMRRG